MYPPSQNIASRKSRESGMSMIEVLIAIVILALGALGIAGLQARALKGNEGSLQRSQALIAASYMLDSIRADAALRVTTSMASSGSGTIGTWLSELSRTVGPGSQGMIACQAVTLGTNCTVTVQWNNSRSGGSASEQLSLSTLL